MNKIKELFFRYKELILYIFFGGMTTVVDFAVYWLFTRLIPIGTVPAQILSIAAAIVFAYFVNKIFVFADKSKACLANSRRTIEADDWAFFICLQF